MRAARGADPEEPVNQPAFEWDGTERINILLLGTDAAPGRDTVLTDVMLVVSVDPVAQTAVMISVPRDTGYVPLPDATLFADGLYPDKVNELATQAALDPATWCPDLADDAEACGLRTVERSIGLYLGIQIHHYALVDMAGFASMIDAIGGVELCLDGRLVDPQLRRKPDEPRDEQGPGPRAGAAASTTASRRSPMPGAGRATSRCRTESGCSRPTSTAPSASSASCSRCAAS